MEELDLRQLFAYFRRHLWLIVSITLIFTSITLSFSYFFIQPQYEATATLYVFSNTNRDDFSISTTDITTAQKLIATYSVIMQSNGVINKVLEDTQLDYTPDQVRKMLSGRSVNNTEVMAVTIKNPNPVDAMLLANSFVDVAPEDIQRVIKASAVEILDRADIPTSPSSPNLMVNTAIGFVLGLIASLTFVLLYETFNTKLRNEEGLLRAANLPIIGFIPKFDNNGSSDE